MHIYVFVLLIYQAYGFIFCLVFYICFLFITSIFNNDFFTSTSLVSVWPPTKYFVNLQAHENGRQL